MDQHDPSRRQYAPQSYLPPTSQSTVTQQSHHPLPPPAPPQSHPIQYSTPSSNARLRNSFLQPSPPSLPSSARASTDAQNVYGFNPGAGYDGGTAMQYSHDMQTSEVARQSTQHAYPSYGSNVMSAITQAHSTPPAPSQYDPVAQYRQRVGSSDALTGSFGVPQSSQYYMGGQPVGSSAAAGEMPAPPLPIGYSHSEYGQAGPSTASTYPSMMDTSPTGAYASYPGPGPPSQQHSQQSQHSPYSSHQSHSQQQHSQHSQTQSQAPLARPPQDEATLERYRNQIRQVFTIARDGSLHDRHGTLLQASQTLLGSIEATGLTLDDKSQRDFRIRLWDEFNNAWLITLQRQYDLTEEMLHTGRSLREPLSIMPLASLEYLGRELIRLCDAIEPHGLVDYQMGVAEEEILELLLRCIHLQSPATTTSSSSSYPRTGEPAAHDPGMAGPS